MIKSFLYDIIVETNKYKFPQIPNFISKRMSEMKKFFHKNKTNKLTFSFVIIIICVTVLAFTVALSLGYYNVNNAVNILFDETVSNYQSNIMQNINSIDRRLNFTTYQMLRNSQIHSVITDSNNNQSYELTSAASAVSTYVSDYTGYADLYIINTRTEEIFTKHLLPTTNRELSTYIKLEDLLENCKNSKKNYIAPNDNDYVIITTYDFRGFAIAYIFERNILFDSVCNFDDEQYQTAVYYHNSIFLSNNASNEKFPEILKEIPQKTHSLSNTNYTILTDINSSISSDFYEPFIKQIVIFSLVIILIGIVSLIVSVKIFGKTSETYINNLLAHSQQHQYSAIKSIIQKAIRNQYLQQSDEDTIVNYFDEIDFSFLYCCQIKLDRINTMLLSYSYKNIALYMQKIKLIFENKLSPFGTCIIIDIDFDTIGIILAANENYSQDELNDAISSARADIDDLMTLTVTVANTQFINSSSEILNTFIHLDQLMKYRYFTGNNSTITDKDEISETQIYPISKQQQILTAMLSGKMSKFKLLIKDFFDDAKKVNCDDAKKWILYLSMALSKHYPSTEGAVEMISQLSLAETIDEQFDILNQYFVKDVPDIDPGTASEESFMTRANDIIEAEYQNLDFNLSSLADSLELSAVYAGKKFKSVFEKNFTSYLAEFRVHKAIDLMLTTDMTSADISEKCGFSSPTYFSKTFKSITNMTPSEYRRKINP